MISTSSFLLLVFLLSRFGTLYPFAAAVVCLSGFGERRKSSRVWEIRAGLELSGTGVYRADSVVCWIWLGNDLFWNDVSSSIGVLRNHVCDIDWTQMSRGIEHRPTTVGRGLNIGSIYVNSNTFKALLVFYAVICFVSRLLSFLILSSVSDVVSPKTIGRPIVCSPVCSTRAQPPFPNSHSPAADIAAARPQYLPVSQSIHSSR